ncbi:MAG: hypothetical protein AMJ43_11160 [Coxiella sp. DG_40]|nr:MAG: hypothetical protein AMJ43_11160 [Coxiella sp. DG_40]
MNECSQNGESRIPVILLDQSAMPAFQIFNPNNWKGGSKAVVLSCSTEFSVLHYTVNRINEMCRSPKDRCQSHFDNLKQHCIDPIAILPKTVCYAQVPELHVLIEGFFSSIKSLLDLIVQLLSTEKIVGIKLDGFHRTKNIYGGTVLNALERNACSNKKEVAKALKGLIIKHKQLWIDEVIAARDILVHPLEGVHQLMFELRMKIQG